MLALGTLLTQVGGIVFVGTYLVFRCLVIRAARGGILRSGLAALAVYFAATLLIVPPLASHFGRVPLPLWQNADQPIAPRSIFYPLLNRHYVTPELRDVVLGVSRKVADRHPGTIVRYLDANFPFLDGFPLFPHLSHSDGRKVDLAFLYHSRGEPDFPAESPSPIGYWIYEAPQPGEPAPYAESDCFFRWDFDFLQRLGRDRVLDESRTRTLIRSLLREPEIRKVILELHLHHRLGLAGQGKLRFQQCNAARHDDHLHLEVR